MTHSPPLPVPAPTAADVARRLREMAATGARRPLSLTQGDLDLLCAAAGLIELSFGPVPVVAGEGAA